VTARGALLKTEGSNFQELYCMRLDVVVLWQRRAKNVRLWSPGCLLTLLEVLCLDEDCLTYDPTVPRFVELGYYANDGIRSSSV
jgi:hypothetical protein